MILFILGRLVSFEILAKMSSEAEEGMLPTEQVPLRARKNSVIERTR